MEPTQSPVNGTHLDLFRSKPSWTPERVSQLREMWGEGFSGSDVAKATGMTRNAVLGKLHRLGLLGKVGPRVVLTPEQQQERYQRKLERMRVYAKNNRPKLTAYQREWRAKNRDACREISRRYYVRHKHMFRARKALYHAKRMADTANRITDLRMLPHDTPAVEQISLDNISINQCRWPYEGRMFCGKQTTKERSYCAHHHGRAYL
jgi:hypothetical protein